jgi:hypothetical protein
MSHQDHQAVNLSPFTRHTPTVANTSRTQPFQQGDYLTDRRRLYRVLEIVPAKFKKRAAILEDCRTLDATLFCRRSSSACDCSWFSGLPRQACSERCAA